MSLNLCKRFSNRSFFSALTYRSYASSTRNVAVRDARLSLQQAPFLVVCRRFTKPMFNQLRCLSSLPTHIIIKLPNLSPTMETGNVASWGKNEGDEVAEGDLLAEIETDKATMAFDSTEAGYLAKILVPAGARDVPVGTPLCVMVEEASSVAAFADFKAPDATAPPPKSTAPAARPTPSASKPPTTSVAPQASSVVSPSGGERLFISPLAKRLAAEQGISLAQLTGLTGTGLHGSITSVDLANVQPGAAAISTTAGAATGTVAVPTGGFVDMPLSNIRAVIAKRLTESKQTVPHYYLTVDIELDNVLQLRTDLNASLSKLAGKEGKPSKITVNDVLVKAAALTCLKIPECNSAWHGDFIRQYTSADINVAIATPAGLITPIVFGAEKKGLLQINAEVRELASKAKENKLKPHEFQGGTFTISNLGMFGISSFSAIINPPQACILAVGQTREQVVADASATRGYRSCQILSVTLCCDHRVVDGAVGAQWLAEFKQILEHPSLMLM